MGMASPFFGSREEFCSCCWVPRRTHCRNHRWAMEHGTHPDQQKPAPVPTDQPKG